MWWPFKKRLWKEVARELLRRETDIDFHGRATYFKVWAVTYEDLNSDKKKVKEVWTLD